MPAQAYILVLNSGSSSVKFAMYEAAEHGVCVGHGAITGIGSLPKLAVDGPLFTNKDHPPPRIDTQCATTSYAVHMLIKWLEQCFPADALKAVGHRVVHGGDNAGHARITPAFLAELKALIPLAPLHQPYNLEAAEMIARLHPDVPQVACFDTVFHATMPPLSRRFALPRKWHDQGVKRYGFHGLSYEYIAARLKEVAPQAFAGRTVVAHLGNGASLCALKGGQSIDTSMGFSALDGLMMGTRPGAVDAGAILYFMQHAGLDEKAIERLLYRESGLLGVSGISADMATLLASPAPEAGEAVNLFCLRVAREAGALVSMLGGIDALVFTAGIGEHAAPVRAKIMERLAWAGLELDTAKNAAAKGETLLSPAASKAQIWMIPTDEEIVIARHARRIAGIGGS